jgi:hypothetical protein
MELIYVFCMIMFSWVHFIVEYFWVFTPEFLVAFEVHHIYLENNVLLVNQQTITDPV